MPPGTADTPPGVSFAMTTRRLLVCCVLLAAVAASCGDKSIQAPATPRGGEIAGVLVSQQSDGSHRSVQGGAHVGVYLKSFPPGGPMMMNPPRPVRTTTTAANGTFHFERLRPGRYYVAL